MAADKRSYAAGKFMMSLDGEPSLLKSFDGGNIKAEVVTHAQSTDLYAVKHISTLKFEPFKIEVGISMGKGLYEWIKASLDKAHVRKNGFIASANYDYKAMEYRHFRDALITEITVPALDAASKDSAYLTVGFRGEEITMQKGDNADLKGVLNTKQKAWLCSNFRVEIGGLPCARVSKIDSFTIKQNVVDDAVGSMRINCIEPSQIEIPNLKLTISAADLEPWAKWFDDFVIKGNNGQDKELNGAIEFLDPSMSRVLGTVNLMNVGIFSMAQQKQEKGDKINSFVVELYVEKMAFDIKEV